MENKGSKPVTILLQDCLVEVCELVNPTMGIIPIHSLCSDDFKKLPVADELKEKVVTVSFIKC